ncbi:PREDICTED: LOB domain-containing protein 18-like isoform X2 [Tarenaya hassleriana]|uniref:LOB domain-containing protein 18-like isoform X1 n=1 Tax=Tarenaya hassleriana TaxID=28532 RepID=UPI00053C3FE2|nr:PREDICTED: LOB domain-containing protein 18-like isoform X1 [Tarenaya hassleriana]XP_010544657.1 PREDICTED: LOB domain-containing protein 18-like isoform X2 [Tarenaya hassleriana]
MSGGGSSSEGNGPCGACKFLRRKCVPGCIFAPYFDSEQGATYFAAVHKVFGASNVSKLLLQIPVHKRSDAVITISYEAHARLRDPVYGCVAQIFALQQQVVNLQTELSFLQAHLATLEPPQLRPPPPPPPVVVPPPLTISDLPVFSASPPTTYDLSSFFDPTALRTPSSSSSWANMQRRIVDPRQQYGAVSSSSGNELQTLAHELFQRHVSPPPPPPPPATDGSPSRSMSR